MTFETLSFDDLQNALAKFMGAAPVARSVCSVHSNAARSPVKPLIGRATLVPQSIEKLDANYDSAGRLAFTPDLHDRHALPWTVAEQKYLVENFEAMGTEGVAMALDRTYNAVSSRAQLLRKQGLLPETTTRRVHRRTATAAKKNRERDEAKRKFSETYRLAPVRSKSGLVSGFQLWIGLGGAGYSMHFACSKHGGVDGAEQAARLNAKEMGLVERAAGVKPMQIRR